MEAYLNACDLWEAINEDLYKVPTLLDNATVAQIKNHKERKQRKSKAKIVLFEAVSSTMLIKIMKLKTPDKISEFLKQAYDGNKKVKVIQMLNLV